MYYYFFSIPAHLKVFFGVLWLSSLFCFTSKSYSRNDLRIKFMKNIFVVFLELQSLKNSVCHSMFSLSALNPARALTFRLLRQCQGAASRRGYPQHITTSAHDLHVCFSDTTLIFGGGRTRIYCLMKRAPPDPVQVC